jgi:hypothetical protein
MTTHCFEEFVSIPTAVFDKAKAGEISMVDASLYAFLLLLSPTENPVYCGSAESLAAVLVIPKNSCRKSIRHLEKSGLVRVTQNRRSFIEICTDISNPFRCSKFRPPIPQKIRDEVLSRGSCVLCGSTSNLTVDHIVAYSRGGAHDISNFQCLCAKCNRKKWCN